MMWKSETRKGNANLEVSGGMPLCFTSQAETFDVRSMDISDKLMSYYIQQYLPSGQVPIVEYGRPVGYALNE